MSFNHFLNESRNPKLELLPKELLPKDTKYIDYFELGLKDLDSSASDIFTFLENHNLIRIESDDVWEVMCKSKEPINPADAIFSMVAYKIKEWLQEKTNKIGVKVQKLGYISFNYEHDDDLDGISYVEELLGLEDYGYIEEGKLKPLDKNSNYKAQFNY